MELVDDLAAWYDIIAVAIDCQQRPDRRIESNRAFERELGGWGGGAARKGASQVKSWGSGLGSGERDRGRASAKGTDMWWAREKLLLLYVLRFPTVVEAVPSQHAI